MFGIVQGGIFAVCENLVRKRLKWILMGMQLAVCVANPNLILRGVDDTVIHLLNRSTLLNGRGNVTNGRVERWVDMFDCVMPTRQARNELYQRRGRYPVKAAIYRDDERSLEEGCSCYACKKFTRSYIRHLLNVGEILGLRLITLYNLHCYLE